MTKTGSKYHFAYGSNMDHAQMSRRCPWAVLVGSAKLRGCKFIINSSGVATIIPQSSSEVYGMLWDITKVDERILDRYEGVKSKMYRKEMVDVEIDRGKTVTALAYIANDSTFGIPLDDYMERIVIAAGQHGLPNKYMDELRSWLKKGNKVI